LRAAGTKVTMPSPITLIALAAGRSTRFGRPKQQEPVGPRGETIPEITIGQALRAGCHRVRLVTSPALAEAMRQQFAAEPRVEVCVQEEARGTAHAAMLGMDGAAGTCIVVNGDDLYGREGLQAAATHALAGDPRENALVAYALGRTLSPNGPVNRAVCEAEGGLLSGTREVPGLVADGPGRARDGAGNTYTTDVPVSMNLWVFRPAFISVVRGAWQVRAATDRSEFGLPDAVRHAIGQGQAFRLLQTGAAWHGLTFPEDAARVREHLARTDEP
jgi:hypothetical protein